MRIPRRLPRLRVRSAPAIALTLLVICSLVSSLVGCGDADDGGRVLVLGLDGLDPQTCDLLLAEGKMPNLAKLRQHGAYGRLESQKPLLSPIVWTTIATGRSPADHGIGHFVAVDEDGNELPATSDMRRVRAVWNIASDAGKEVATVGWWATWPPEEIDGVVVSDHVAYHFLFEEGLHGETGGGLSADKVHPPELAEEIAPLLRRPTDLGAEELSTFADLEPQELEGSEFDYESEVSHLRWALSTAMSYRDIGLELWRSREPDLGMIYIEATDSTAHLFGHLFRGEGLQGELAEQQKRFGRTVEEVYFLADRILGQILDTLDDDTTLIVVSDHGFQLGALHDDPSKTRDLRRVSERFHRLHGVIYLYGNKVRRGARIDDASIVDVTPTILGLLGIPASGEMKGRLLTEALEVEPLPRVASYEPEGGTATRTAARDTQTDQAMVEHLRALGYLDDGSAGTDDSAGDGAGGGGETGHSAPTSMAGDRNLAAILFGEERYEEAAAIYRRLIEENPGDPTLHTSLAGALGSLRRYEEALAEIEKAIEIEPLNVEAYHNRAVLRERSGDIAGAVDDYRRALRYASDYRPSQEALVRLVGDPSPRPLTAEQRASMVLLDEAAQAARRGDYARAEQLLADAESRTPDFVLVYQYRSNVAYLAGDAAGAIRALEKALEIEPDNALYRRNLQQLRATTGAR